MPLSTFKPGIKVTLRFWLKGGRSSCALKQTFCFPFDIMLICMIIYYKLTFDALSYHLFPLLLLNSTFIKVNIYTYVMCFFSETAIFFI